MKLFSIFLFLISLFSGNIQFIIFFAYLLIVCYKSYEKTSLITAYFLTFLVVFPVAFTGETIWDRNLIYIFSIFFVLFNSYKNKPFFLKAQSWQIKVLIVLVVAALIIYLPILIETYFNLKIFTGPEELFISNHRASHMLGFALPVLLGPLIIISLFRTFREGMNFEDIYSTLRHLTWIVIILTLIRYFFQIEIIPQSYISSIRNDGFRLSGFNHPDSISWGKMIMIPLAFSLSYVMAKQKYHNDIYLLFLILSSIFLTYSRILIIGSTIILIVVALYNFRFSLIIKGSLFVFVLFTTLYYSGSIGKLMSRNESSFSASGINLSGRDLIYETGIPIVAASPLVGLRPGGYVSMLQKGYTFSTSEGYTGLMTVQSAHSWYLVMALEWGLPFLFLIVCVMLHCIYLLHLTIRLTRRYSSFIEFSSIRIWSVAVMALICGFLILGITDYVPYPFVFFLIGLTWSLNLIVTKTISLHSESIKSIPSRQNLHENTITS